MGRDYRSLSGETLMVVVSVDPWPIGAGYG